MALPRYALASPASLLASLTCSGCAGWQSVVEPQGAPARGLEQLIWMFIGVAAAVWFTVMLVLLGCLRRRALPVARDAQDLSPDEERHLRVAVTAATVATALIVAGLTVASFVATSAFSRSDPNALQIRVRGHQWWWEVTYLDRRADQVFTTANEIHIPVGRTIRLELSAADVIHSFWAPNLAGKQDLIPGRENTLTLTAQQVGTFRGQCAEFCGVQHAHMSLLVIAETPGAFAQWRRSQLASAASASDPQQVAGQKVFTSKPCASCHTIEGTSAAASIGPDLTHVASRRYIAAGLLETTRGSLAAWVADPQNLKPGNNMPAVPLTATELQALSAYLASLK
jgi:cytochrome c oxidase subunit II